MSIVVGVDIGGTKTRIAVASRDGVEEDLLQDVVVPSSSWRGEPVDPAGDAVGLRDLIVAHLGDGALSAPLVVGAHGCDSTAQCDELAHELRGGFTGPVHVVNDSELLVPAMGGSRGIGLVVGTGSIATTRSPGGELVTAGGWGWLLGDEGSAPSLVREAVRVVLAGLDRGDPPDPLGDLLFEAFQARDAAQLALSATQTAGAWGVHAPAVFAAADAGSLMAGAVIRAAGEELAQLVDVLIGRGIRARSVVAGGSVIEGQPRLQDALRAALVVDHPSIDLMILDRPPVLGAVVLARRMNQETTPHPSRIGESNT